jgi:hypothetical protein
MVKRAIYVIVLVAIVVSLWFLGLTQLKVERETQNSIQLATKASDPTDGGRNPPA